MRKLFPITALIFTLILAYPMLSFSHGMTDEGSAGSESDDGHTAREEAEGKEIWTKLQAEELKCENLSDDDFGALGEYFMGQTMGDSHEDMNNTMIRMMGEEGEEEMHIAMGKRMSQCEPNAAIPGNMMNGGMMNYSFASSGWIFMVLFWILIIAGIVALIKWIAGSTGNRTSLSALDILKERYAKGEINKKEFEEKKKDLN